MNKNDSAVVRKTFLVLSVVISTLLILFAVYKIRSVIPPILYGVFIAYLLLPLTNFFSKKMPRFLASLLSILLFLLIFSLLGYILIPQVTRQFGELVKRIPDIFHSITTYINEAMALIPLKNKTPFLDEFIKNLSNNIESGLNIILNKITTTLIQKVSLIPSIFLSLILAFFFMKDSESLFSMASHLFNGRRNKIWVLFLKKTNRDVRDYYSLLLLVALATGFVMGLMSYFVGIPYYLLIGAMDSILELLPYIGPTIVFTTGSIFALFKSFNTFLLFAVFFFAIEIVQSQIVIPHFAGRKINLPPLAVILLIILGGALGGALGIIIAVPTFLVVKNAIRFLVPNLYKSFSGSNNE